MSKFVQLMVWDTKASVWAQSGFINLRHIREIDFIEGLKLESKDATEPVYSVKGEGGHNYQNVRFVDQEGRWLSPFNL